MLKVEKFNFEEDYSVVEGACCDFTQGFVNADIIFEGGEKIDLYIFREDSWIPIDEEDIKELFEKSESVKEFELKLIFLIKNKELEEASYSEEKILSKNGPLCDYDLSINSKKIDILDSITNNSIIFR